MAARSRAQQVGQMSFFAEETAVAPMLETPVQATLVISEEAAVEAPVVAAVEPEPQPAPPAPSKPRRKRATRARTAKRIQTGVRLEERFLHVARAVADAKRTTLGRLLEQLTLHAFAATDPFTSDDREQIEHFRHAYGLSLHPAGGKLKRAQAGILMETRLLKVLKATALLLDRDVAELIEDIGLHTFAGRPAFEDETRVDIADFIRIYQMQLAVESLGGEA